MYLQLLLHLLLVPLDACHNAHDSLGIEEDKDTDERDASPPNMVGVRSQIGVRLVMLAKRL